MRRLAAFLPLLAAACGPEAPAAEHDDVWHIEPSGAHAAHIDSVHVIMGETHGEETDVRIIAWIDHRALQCVRLRDGRQGWVEVLPYGIDIQTVPMGRWLDDPECAVRIWGPGEERPEDVPGIPVRVSPHLPGARI